MFIFQFEITCKILRWCEPEGFVCNLYDLNKSKLIRLVVWSVHLMPLQTSSTEKFNLKTVRLSFSLANMLDWNLS